ncbi:MAG TPA: hypothetical protein VIG64_11615 [Actinomycetota bacterium]|jgi:hypothetical protein
MKTTPVPNKGKHVEKHVEVEQLEPDEIPPPSEEFRRFFEKAKSKGDDAESIEEFERTTRARYTGTAADPRRDPEGSGRKERPAPSA